MRLKVRVTCGISSWRWMFVDADADPDDMGTIAICTQHYATREAALAAGEAAAQAEFVEPMEAEE